MRLSIIKGSGKQRLTLAPLLGVLAALSVACGGGPVREQAQEAPQRNAGSEALSVVATIYPLEYLAKRIGADRVQAITLVPPGAEPHDWEPSFEDIAAVLNAALFLYNGAGFEPWANRILSGLPPNGPLVINASAGLALVEGEAEGDGGGAGAGERGLDPHVWLDPVLYGQQAEHVAEGLIRADPAGAEAYRANLAPLQADLATLTREIELGLASCKRRTVVVSHASFSYFASRFGLEQLAISGLSPEAETSPYRLRSLIKEVQQTGATHVFGEPFVLANSATTIAKEAGLTVAVLSPLEGLTEQEISAGNDYFSVMRKNVNRLREGLECL